MWWSGTLRLWLTGKSVGSVKNLRNDSDLKWLCRAKIMADDRAACLCSLSSPVWLIQVFVSLSVETCWKYAVSPSCLTPPPNRKRYMQIELFCQVSLEMVCFTVCLLSANLHEATFFFFKSRKKFQLTAQVRVLCLGVLLFLLGEDERKKIKFYNCMTMMGFLYSSCRSSKRQVGLNHLPTQQSTFPCVFGDQLCSTGLVTWEDRTIPQWKLAMGWSHNVEVSPPQSNCRCVPTQSCPPHWVMFVSVGQWLRKRCLLVTFSM